jgi:hypothetical protein
MDQGLRWRLRASPLLNSAALVESRTNIVYSSRCCAPNDAEKEALYEQIGRLKVELDWLKKTVGLLD